jgi:prepilin-type N-terminal cleavage/methylation domain-containing protein
MPVSSTSLRNKPHSPRRGRAKNAGFTLIELMIVIIIVGLVSAIAIPNYISTVQNVTFESHYRETRALFNKCRGSALEASSPATMPTTLALYTNGLACVTWNDLNNDGQLQWTDLDGDGLPNKGEGEVFAVFHAVRFDREIAINAATTKTRIDLDNSTLPPGNFWIVSNAGYFQTHVRTTMQASVRMLPESGGLSQFLVFPSGQIVGN